MDTQTRSHTPVLTPTAAPFAYLLHDLQQPLQAARLFTDLLTRAEDGDRARLIDALHAALAAMDAMVGGAVTAAADQDVYLGPTPLGPVLAQVGKQCASIAAAHGVALRVLTTKAVVISERGRLERVLRNLVVNALSHAGGGSVLVGVHRCRGLIRVEVCDQGRGMEAARLHQLFQGGRCFGPTAGTGLGLASVRWLAAQLDHPVAVSSAPGRGTRFDIVLKAAT
ncbi:sensor histidine kinase [Azospirillum largimobile]